MEERGTDFTSNATRDGHRRRKVTRYPAANQLDQKLGAIQIFYTRRQDANTGSAFAFNPGCRARSQHRLPASGSDFTQAETSSAADYDTILAL